MNQVQKPTIVDFFCGAGGFTEGFKQMGFQPLYGYDSWLTAIQTYNHNFGLSCDTKNISVFFSSIEEINNVPNSTVIVGSPPCVSFSTSNKSGKAEKGLGLQLIKSFLRVVAVKKHQPSSILSAWFMENVINSKRYLQVFYTFEDLNLSEWAISIGKNPNDEALRVKPNTMTVNSADYGSHQARKRSISGEIFSKGGFSISTPTHSETGIGLKKWRTLGGLLAKLPMITLRAPIGALKDPIYPNIKIETSRLSDYFYDSGLYEWEWKQSQEQKINHHCMGKMAFPENREKPSRTITATKSATSRESLIYKSDYKRRGNGEYRTPTIRELASLMCFPITYQFYGNQYAKWKQIGNAVCPSVSRALAKEVLIQNNYPIPTELVLNKEVVMGEICDLNTFNEVTFNKPPKRTKNSRFRRHPLKDGNLTVTLSNFDIRKKNKPNGKWITSIQFGNGANYKHQEVADGMYPLLEDFIRNNIRKGNQFIKVVNNGFSEKVANSSLLQKMYEEQESKEGKYEPTKLVINLRDLITSLELDGEFFMQGETKIFLYKDRVPLTQVLALYGINKIATMANES